MGKNWEGKLERLDDFRWRIPETFQKGMRVPGIIFSDKEMLQQIRQDQAPQQVVNVAHLPGIVRASMAMPDIHWGYGFPIGGVAALDVEEGVISPGGVGYDINCGVRLLRTNLIVSDIKDVLVRLVETLFRNIPCGVGSKSKLRLSRKELNKVLKNGSSWAVKQGLGWEDDIEYTEENGCLKGADPGVISTRALNRGMPQLGTLGSGNHFLEIQVVDEIFDEEIARIYGLEKGEITVMIHTGSRGFGHQVCDDSLNTMVRAVNKYNITLPDKQLACVPVTSSEGKKYFAAMAAAANYAWTNRQVIMHWVRESFEQVLGQGAEKMGMDLVYDVAHNIAKFETHEIEGKKQKLIVHRKGATRAFPPHHPLLPEEYKKAGQPVLIPGDMGTASYVLAGTHKAMELSFGSTCHGAGRVMSRRQAVKRFQSTSIQNEFEKQGIIIRSRGRRTLFEEAPGAYKEIDKITEIVQGAGISKRVARMRPMGVVKG
ncbi:MAG: RtcB family protein [bacterium]